MDALEFRNELVKRLNENATRYNGSKDDVFPFMETFDVDEVYEIIDDVLFGIPVDRGSCEEE